MEAAEKLWMDLAKARAQMDAGCTADEVEHEAAWCQEAMGNVLDAMVKKIRICSTSKRWWNTDIKKRRKAVGREKRRRRNSDEAASAKAELQKSIRQSKRTMCSDYLQNMRGGGGMEGSTIRKPSGGHNRGSLNRQKRQASKHITREGGDAEAGVFSSE